jgi:hypothetical protein
MFHALGLYSFCTLKVDVHGRNIPKRFHTTVDFTRLVVNRCGGNHGWDPITILAQCKNDYRHLGRNPGDHGTV